MKNRKNKIHSPVIEKYSEIAKGESIDAHEGDGSSCSSDEVSVMEMERRG